MELATILAQVRSYKMEKIEIISIELPVSGEIEEVVIIDRGNGEFTSMPKAIYDEQQANQASGTIS